MSETQGSKTFVNSLARGLLVIRAFSREAPEMTLSEVAEKTGLSRAAARRFLLTLAELGYAYSDGRRFGLTPRVLELGFAYLSSTSIWELAVPIMEQVSAKLGENCSASVLDETDIIYVARVPTQRIMSVTLNLGTRLPAFNTSMGRVLLASLSPEEARERLCQSLRTDYTPRTLTEVEVLMDVLAQTHSQGYALVDQELEEGLRSLAVPLHNKRGNVLAALNTNSHANRVSVDVMLHEYLPVLQQASQDIANALL